MKAYPLAWPTGWKRTEPHRRVRAKFGTSRQRHSGYRGIDNITVAEATQRVLKQLSMMGVLEGDSIISTNLKLRLDGLPRSDQAAPLDPGAAVYWQFPNSTARKVMAIDQYDRVEGNLAAIAATLEAMRAIERHGGAMILERAFTGFTALPAPGETTGTTWRTILNVEGGEARLTVAEHQYRALRSRYHPDKPTGNADMFNLVQKAWEQAQAELGNPP